MGGENAIGEASNHTMQPPISTSSPEVEKNQEKERAELIEIYLKMQQGIDTFERVSYPFISLTHSNLLSESRGLQTSRHSTTGQNQGN